MPTQPEALLLADELEDMTCLWSPSVNRARVDKAAAELRRLHAENFALAAGQCMNVVGDEGGTPMCAKAQQLQAAHERDNVSFKQLLAQRDALMEALQDLCDTLGECGMTEKARAVIKKVQEGD